MMVHPFEICGMLTVVAGAILPGQALRMWHAPSPWCASIGGWDCEIVYAICPQKHVIGNKMEPAWSSTSDSCQLLNCGPSKITGFLQPTRTQFHDPIGNLFSIMQKCATINSAISTTEEAEFVTHWQAFQSQFYTRSYFNKMTHLSSLFLGE